MNTSRLTRNASTASTAPAVRLIARPAGCTRTRCMACSGLLGPDAVVARRVGDDAGDFDATYCGRSCRKAFLGGAR